MASRGVLIPLCITLGLACTNDEAPSGEDVDARVGLDAETREDSSAVDASAGLTPDANTVAPDGGDGPAGWLPSQCEGVMAPLLNPVCLQALSEACAKHKTERECASQETLDISTFRFRCGWARVVTFADVSTCEGVQSVGRCVPAFLDRVAFECSFPCPAPGEPGNPDMRSSFLYTAADELIEAFCIPSGPPMAAVGVGGIGRCDFGPSHPLCACAAAACAGQ